MPIVAITGGIASGKSAACAKLASLGVPIIDTDVISHQITGSNGAAIEPIRQAFGAQYINADNALDRSKMRELVFKDQAARQQLEAITHPLIRQQVSDSITQNQTQLTHNAQIHYQVIAIPLLFETEHYLPLVDFSVVIDCEPAQQIKRAIARSQLTEAAVKSIMRAQLPREKRLALADFVIENNADIDTLNVKIDALHVKLNQSCYK